LAYFFVIFVPIKKFMLRKAAHIAIVILLLVATGGVPVTKHFCGKVQKSVSIYTSPKPCCGGHCDKCRNVFSFTRVNDDFVPQTSNYNTQLTEIVALQAAIVTTFFWYPGLSPLTEIKNQRAYIIQFAGVAPAFLGNFRC
jgi:hypothetical protein